MDQRQRLPRSLDPLPNESLAGLLLRLSHRAGISPADMAVHLGLPTSGGDALTASKLFALHEDEVTAIAHGVGISVQQVNAMTLSSVTSRYLPMIRKRNLQTRQLKAALIKENWISNFASRYCPQCLTSRRDSPIQQLHGGSWNIHWRLPVLFACTTHDQLLHHLCPQCQLPAHHGHPGPLPCSRCLA